MTALDMGSASGNSSWGLTSQALPTSTQKIENYPENIRKHGRECGGCGRCLNLPKDPEISVGPLLSQIVGSIFSQIYPQFSV